MRFIELIESTKNYYHGSSIILPLNTILVGRNIEYEKDWQNTDFYHILEQYRPANMLPHKNAVFMVDNIDDIDLAGGATDFIFTLKPLDIVQKHDINWSSEISLLKDYFVNNEISKDEFIHKSKQAAINYWDGIPHYNESVWEYLTSQAQIIKIEEY